MLVKADGMLPRPFICQAAYIYINISILISEIAFENDSTLNVIYFCISMFSCLTEPQNLFLTAAEKKQN